MVSLSGVTEVAEVGGKGGRSTGRDQGSARTGQQAESVTTLPERRCPVTCPWEELFGVTLVQGT